MFSLPRLLGNVLSAKVNDSLIMRSSKSLGGEDMSQHMVTAVTFRTAFEAVGNNSEKISSRMYNFSTMQNIRMQYEL